MNIDKSRNPWSWYLKLLYEDNGSLTKSAVARQMTNTDNSALDSVTTSWKTKYAQIENTIASGKPLTDVSFEEFCSDYYFCPLKTTERGGLYEVKQAYTQAVRGTNDIIEKQDWYGDEVNYTPAIVNSVPFQEHLRDLAKKWVSGIELTEAEKRAITSDTEVYQNAFVQRSFYKKSAQINNILSEIGIVLADNETIGISLQGYTFTVSGDLSKEIQKAIEAALNSMSKNEKESYGALCAMHNVTSYTKYISQNQRFISTSITEAEYLLEQYSGGTIKLLDLSMDSFFQIKGLPKGLEMLFETINTLEPAVIPEKFALDLAKTKAYIINRGSKVAVETAVKAMINLGYENLPRYSYEFAFRNGQLSAVAIYTK